MNKKGFTLIELIATIVIIILMGLIITPKVMNIIKDNRIKGYKEIERRLEEAAGKYIIENYTDSSLPFIKIEKNQLIEGKYIDEIYDLKDKSVCDAYVMVSNLNKTADFNAHLQCSSYESMLKSTIHVEDLYYDVEKRSLNGLEKTSDGNIRYTGASPKNYVKFNNEDWRIIGLFEVKTASGKTEKLMKIVRNGTIGGYSWDSSTGNNNGAHDTGEVNDGLGVNQWGASTYTNGEAYEGADLMRELNTLYLNQGSGNCFNGTNNAYTACNFSTTGIKDTYRGMIENVVWNTAGVATHASGRIGQSSLTAYNEERGTTTGQICKGTTYLDGAWCTDEVTRTTTWEGRVGLIYPSDYGYASTNTSCRAYINDSTNYSCKNDNWLHNNTYYWTLSPNYGSGDSLGAWLVDSNGNVHNSSARDGAGFRSSVYLKSNVSITNGDGSSSNPYQISINS